MIHYIAAMRGFAPDLSPLVKKVANFDSDFRFKRGDVIHVNHDKKTESFVIEEMEYAFTVACGGETLKYLTVFLGVIPYTGYRMDMTAEDMAAAGLDVSFEGDISIQVPPLQEILYDER